jgi:uncharacterized surface protein with fasciclin (FAS1) repeats
MKKVLAFVGAALLSTVLAQSSTPGTIVEVATANKDFTTLVTAIQAAGLAETLSGKGPFTVFAPTNAAFAKLPKGTLETLLKPENKMQLTDILTYHVVAGAVKAADVVKLDGKMAKTVNGGEVKVKLGTDKDGKATVMVNDALVTGTDVMASNGVIHVVDTVLMPPKKMK